jgi:hypothetical protein
MECQNSSETEHLWLPNQNQLQDAIHGPHLAERDRAIEVLWNAPEKHLKRAAVRMAGCGSHVDFYIDQDSGQIRRYTHNCKSRLCPHCARKRTARVAEQMDTVVEPMKFPRHLVLTVKSTNTPLRGQMKDLRKWFTELRKKPFVKKALIGGVYTMESTINERTGLWHPHLHIIYDGAYMPQMHLRKLWHSITGGSDVVWIEQAKDKHGLVLELCKYIGKPQDSEHWTDTQFIDYARAIHGVRMVQTFGKVAKQIVEDDAEEEARKADIWTISLAKICWLAEQDNKASVKLLVLMAQRWPDLARYLYQRCPQFLPDKTPEERLLHAWKVIEAGPAPPRAPPPKPPTVEVLEAAMLPLLDLLRQHSATVMPCR